MRAIPTRYGGVKFRSKTEAHWARYFDLIEMRWVYEPEGLDLDGLWYLPDFWLPDCRTIVEVKGIWSEPDKEKMRLCHAAAYPLGIDIAVGEWRLQPGRPDNQFYFDLLLGLVHPTKYGAGGNPNQPVIDYQDVCVGKCRACGKLWFYTDEGDWTCRNCGIHRGRGHILDVSSPWGGSHVLLNGRADVSKFEPVKL